MKNYWERRAEMNRAMEKYGKNPANRRLLAVSGIAIGIGILLLLSLTIWCDSFSMKATLLLRGCVGIFAIISVIFATIYYYRVNSAYWRNRKK